MVAALLVAAARARADDFGLALADWRRYLKIGVAGFAVLLPPVMLLQVVLNAVWMDSQHPIIVAYRASRDPRLLLWCTVAAVFVAPFVEEFFFRGICNSIRPGGYSKDSSTRSEHLSIIYF